MSQVELAGRVFALERFPVTDDINPLQAWDAADEYLLQQVSGDIDGPLVILNDNFGALTCALVEHHPVFAVIPYLRKLPRNVTCTITSLTIMR